MSGIVKRDGFFALYKGIKPTICGMVPFASLKLTFFQVNLYTNIHTYFIQLLNYFYIKLDI